MKTLVLASHQAQVGRSTLAAILVHHLARSGERVLAIDLDCPATLGQVLRRSDRVAIAALADDALTVDKLPCLPQPAGKPIVLIDGAWRWVGIERAPRRCNEFICNLQDMLQVVDLRFDVCVIDTPFVPDARLLAALASADLVLVPTRPHVDAWRVVIKSFRHEQSGIFQIHATRNPELRLMGLLPTMVEAQGERQVDEVAKLAARSPELFIDMSACATWREENRSNIYNTIAHLPYSRQLAQTLVNARMPWEVASVDACTTWHRIRPCFEAITERIAIAQLQP